MFKIENLLGLFSKDDTKEILSCSYSLLKDKDKDLSDGVFEHLLLLKIANPKINIILDTTKEKSFFDFKENVIYLNNLSIETFFHELTHLFSYNFSHFEVPKEYYLFKNNFTLSTENANLMIKLLNLCKKKKLDFFEQNDFEKKLISTINNNQMENITSVPQSTQFDIIGRIEGIIDAIYDGQSFTQGLCFIKDNNSIAIKSKKASGHGCKYFYDTGYQFEEILADYQAIKLTDPNNDLFALLKEIIGDKFVSFLDQRCREMCGYLIFPFINSYF